jgi:hypothetical protein
MKRKETDRKTSDVRGNMSSLSDLQVRYRLRTLIELSISIGRCGGMFRSLPPLEKNRINIESSDKRT